MDIHIPRRRAARVSRSQRYGHGEVDAKEAIIPWRVDGHDICTSYGRIYSHKNNKIIRLIQLINGDTSGHIIIM